MLADYFSPRARFPFQRGCVACSRIGNAPSLQAVEGEVKRVCEGDEKFPDYFPELEVWPVVTVMPLENRTDKRANIGNMQRWT